MLHSPNTTSMDTLYSSSSEQSSTANTQTSQSTQGSKKRKANRSDTTEEPAKTVKSTEVKKGTSASGFGFDGEPFVDQKFACVTCLRGHRTHECTHAYQGRPVIGPLARGRPKNEEDRRMSTKKCECPRSGRCLCKRRSFVLKEVISADGKKEWKIEAKVISNNRDEILQYIVDDF